MKVIIDISEESYKYIKTLSDLGWSTSPEYANAIRLTASEYANAIKNGTPLPKGHGKIGDLDAVMSDISTSIEEMSNIGITVDGEYLWAKLNDAIYNAPTIIQAEK